MIKKTFFIIIVLCSANNLRAQSVNHPNSEAVFLEINTGTSIVNNSFTDLWDPSPPLHVSIRFPFYTGQIEGGARYIKFHGMAPTQTDSDFRSTFIYLGYAYPLQISSRYQMDPSIRFGNNLMIFDEPEVYTAGTFRYETDPVEMEFSYEFALRNQLQISDHWFIQATVWYNRTLTKFPLPLTMISAGVSYSFAQPKWLNHFLQ